MSDQSAIPPFSPAGPRGPGLRSFGGYEIEGELGRGGMGVVYRARQKRLNRIVALKMLTGHYGPDELTRFLAEAETAAGLHHSNIAHIYEVGENEGAPFYAMEYVEGGSLADRLRKGLLPVQEAAQLLIQVARALHFAHQNGVVHRDMKPGNVLLDADNVPKVADFGIAKRLKEETKLTISGAVIGTPTYMAPEQAKGTSRHAGPAADVYSLGAILYEMLTGRPPFLPEDSETAITVRVLTEDPVSPAWHRPEIPRDLETICMKCLEKEPRDRYASAAAFSEDLRRFLDDETILARPPTTVVRTVKWARRHPWLTSLAIASLLAAALAMERLWRWEIYERPRIEWASGVELVHGGAQPILPMSPVAASHLGVSFRLTRRGRRGPITQVEVLNPRGHPAAVRRIFGQDALPTWLEGALGAQQAEERTRETTRLEFAYAGNDLLETTGSDRNGHVTWRLAWDRVAAQQGSHGIARARFVDLRGFDFTSVQGASHVEFVRDHAGHDVEIHFFSGSGQPAANSDGVFGYRTERGPDGRLVQLTNLGRDDQPMENRLGIIAIGLGYDERGAVARYEYRDGGGHMNSWNGVAFVTNEYDAAGNVIRVQRWNNENKLVNGKSDGWATIENKRNRQGEATEIIYQKVMPEGGLSPLSRAVVEYDPLGYPADIKMSAAASWRRHYLNDATGNVLEERWLDLEGHPITGSDGWSIVRHSYSETVSPPGWRDEQRFFDSEGKKTWSKIGHHCRILQFSQTGKFLRMIDEDHDPARFDFFRYISEPEFDSHGRMRKMVSRTEDKEGRLISGGNGWSKSETDYDEDGRAVTEWKFGCEASGAPAFRTDIEWHKSGVCKRRVRQAFDAARKPLPFISTGTGARFEEDFDEIERLERIYETGFDEKTLGFSSREATFSATVLQSVTHRRADGTALDAVRVIITSVIPQQPKAAELRAGDQLLAANDKPVTSAYHWVYGINFSGGWIEVLREGRRIRIEGFTPAKLGVLLEDRAPAAIQ